MAAPGDLQVSTRTIRLGTTGSSAGVRLSNVGGTALDFTAAPRARWLSVSPRSGSLDPDAQSNLQITADRSALAEGSHSGQVAVTWSGGTVVITVSLTVNRPPVIGTIETAGNDCTGRAISTTITDGSGVRSARVSWTGPSGNGQVAMSLVRGKWRATIGPFPIGGDVTATITATDNTGLRTSRKRTFYVAPCPG